MVNSLCSLLLRATFWWHASPQCQLPETPLMARIRSCGATERLGFSSLGKPLEKKNTELLGRRGGEIPLKWVINPVINWRSRVIFHSCHWGELPRLRFVSHNVPPESPIPYGKLMGIGVPSGRQNIFHGLLDHYHLAIPKGLELFDGDAIFVDNRKKYISH